MVHDKIDPATGAGAGEMKQFWVDIRPWNKDIATTAIESGADALVVDRAEDVRRLGRITTIAPDGDMKLGTDVIECTITDKERKMPQPSSERNNT